MNHFRQLRTDMKKTFEQSLDRLVQVVEALENDGTSLAEAMKLYEE